MYREMARDDSMRGEKDPKKVGRELQCRER
jgi:hypothetical protein